MVHPTYLEPENLVSILRDTSKVSGKDYLIIDVRDEDFEGGIINNSNIPCHEFLENIESHHKKLATVPILIFHCALSQVRGPKSATRYANLIRNVALNTNQKVYILRGGFDGFKQQFYVSHRDLFER
ncbi:hypothetical protein HK099_004650 [Clydaea vesicula]|uniref:Rhodanese domain-containing protein n=1 Tax=Clydaea vesicula TaxID=447962 RepID=A0AAD5U1N5_9FUNG|nr:hypothetical protein HK099_004650 [Clydaea vesicula]KAJ3382575.1 hypothetical protein HDU92_004672 [Lobulomyces angularis]